MKSFSKVLGTIKKKPTFGTTFPPSVFGASRDINSGRIAANVLAVRAGLGGNGSTPDLNGDSPEATASRAVVRLLGATAAGGLWC
jgi:hypothetical protein